MYVYTYKLPNVGTLDSVIILCGYPERFARLPKSQISSSLEWIVTAKMIRRSTETDDIIDIMTRRDETYIYIPRRRSVGQQVERARRLTTTIYISGSTSNFVHQPAGKIGNGTFWTRLTWSVRYIVLNRERE